MKRSPRSHTLDRRTLFLGILMLATVVPVTAQAGGGAGDELQQKLATVK